jgi:hypothetical protein
MSGFHLKACDHTDHPDGVSPDSDVKAGSAKTTPAPASPSRNRESEGPLALLAVRERAFDTKGADDECLLWVESRH